MKTTASALLLCLPAVMLAGSGQRTGTNGASELLIPVGARSIALAGSTVSTARGIDALYWNPAGSAYTLHDATLYASHMTYIADIDVDYGAFSVNFEGFGVVSLDFKILSMGDIPVTTTQYPDGTGTTFSPQFFMLGLSYARQLTDRIAVGATGTVISERMAEVSATGVAFNFGVLYADMMGLAGLDFGVVVKNIGPQMKFDGPGLSVDAVANGFERGTMMYKIDPAGIELPSTFDIGLAYHSLISTDNSVLLTTAFQSNNCADDAYRVGLEYGFQNMVFVRGGYDYQPSKTTERENIYGLTAGMGLHLALTSVDVTVDYAYRAARFFGGNHVFALKIGL
jgi:hypothetical protein